MTGAPLKKGHLFKWKVISSTQDSEFLHLLSCLLQDLETQTDSKQVVTLCKMQIKKEFNHLQTNCVCQQ